MDEVARFFTEVRKNIEDMGEDPVMKGLTNRWMRESICNKYSYNFTWLGRPIIQYPQDIVAMQEILWRVKPELVIETGIAHGGSLIFYASILELIGENGEIIGIDIDIRKHNRVELEKHPLYKRIKMIEGSSVDSEIIKQVYDYAQGRKPVLVALDSNHTHDHVLNELASYSSLVTKGSYLVVFDTVIDDMSEHLFPDRPWGKGNNPKTAVHEFLNTNDRFEVDKEIENKLLITVAPSGYLKCVRD